MAENNVAASLPVGNISAERQHLALAMRALAAAARGQVVVAEEAMETLTARAIYLAAPPPRASLLRLVHWRQPYK